MEATGPDEPIVVLQRWVDAGAIWRVMHRGDRSVTIALYQCDGGEEVDRFTSADPQLLDFLKHRNSSED
ncbi:MAG: hypothetical protein QOH60_4514 [Mycobacterium sp.]|nr:hypothetical protein [Mycobacterium sp.]